MFGQNALGRMLWDHEDKRIGALNPVGEVEASQLPPLAKDSEYRHFHPLRQHLLCDARWRQLFEGARHDPERFGIWGRSPCLLDETRFYSTTKQFMCQGEPGRSGTYDEYISGW